MRMTWWCRSTNRPVTCYQQLLLVKHRTRQNEEYLKYTWHETSMPLMRFFHHCLIILAFVIPTFKLLCTILYPHGHIISQSHTHIHILSFLSFSLFFFSLYLITLHIYTNLCYCSDFILYPQVCILYLSRF